MTDDELLERALFLLEAAIRFQKFGGYEDCWRRPTWGDPQLVDCIIFIATELMNEQIDSVNDSVSHNLIYTPQNFPTIVNLALRLLAQKAFL